MEGAAMPISPIHHRRHGESKLLIFWHYFRSFITLGRVLCTRSHATIRPIFRFFRCVSAHGLPTFTKLKSGSWRAQIRRKGQYVNETFLRRKDAEEWALDMERRIDRQEPAVTRRSRDAKRFRDLVALHRQDMAEVGIGIGCSKDFCLTAIDGALGALKIGELDRERLIKYGKDRAKEGAGPVTVSMDFGYIKTVLSHAAAVHGVTISTETTRSRVHRPEAARPVRERQGAGSSPDAG